MLSVKVRHLVAFDVVISLDQRAFWNEVCICEQLCAGTALHAEHCQPAYERVCHWL